jgi:mannose-6-phosphate isomerase-like protein (cupin superfamily)
MEAFELQDLIERREKSGQRYLEFLNVPDLSLGLYVLPAGGVDPQQPHTEAEAYYVIRGRSLITVGGETRSVQPGTTVFVPAGVEHRFHDISEPLQLLVFFAPAEGSRQG